MRTLTVFLLCVAVSLVVVAVASAGKPMTAAVTASPTPVTPGAMLALVSSVTNHSKDRQEVSVSVEVAGPCGTSSSHGYKVAVEGEDTDTQKANLSAPSCPGEYRATMNVVNGRGIVINSATTTFQVSRALSASAGR